MQLKGHPTSHQSFLALIIEVHNAPR